MKHQEFTANTTSGGAVLVQLETTKENQQVMSIPSGGLYTRVHITREQAMAFFNLRPRPEHDGTDDNCDCGQPTCHNVEWHS